MPSPHYPSAAVQRALQQLGRDLRTARIRRHLTMQVVANRAFTSRQTLQRIEKGDPGVGMGIYAAVMHALGLLDRLAIVADPTLDEVGLARMDDSLPQRVRPRSARKKSSDAR